MLQLKNITKDYYVGEQTIHALRGIDITFRKNEFVSVLGPSGCGKTTLMNIIGGLDRYTSGDLIINGRTTKSFKDKEWDNYRNKRVGFVFQNYNLIPHLSVLGNVELALTLSGMSKEERTKRAKEALRQVGLGEYLRQRPNQLSGGQSQRVAIARAIVNSPDILLADEPTGALDTETSTQIIDLIKEISKDKLVIMVTHNPDIAEKYSTRLIRMVDGKVTSDSMPYTEEKEEQEKPVSTASAEKTVHKKKRTKERSAMSFFTALSLSWKNLWTKTGRTVLTSIAASIGIIGIALILALSGGMNQYISKMQTDTLSSNPLTITETSINITQAMGAMRDREVFEKFPSAKKILVEKEMDLSEIINKNNITDEYITYLQQNLNASWYNDILYKTGMSLAIYGKKPGVETYSELNTSSGGGSGFGGPSSGWQLLLKQDFISSQYDVLEGAMPESKNDIVIIVDDTNRIAEATLIALGLRNVGDEATEYAFSDVIGRQYMLVKNDLIYEVSGSGYVKKSPLDIDYSSAETLTVTGILRINRNTESGVLATGIGYTYDLYQWLQGVNDSSAITAYMDNHPGINPYTGLAYTSTLYATAKEQWNSEYRKLGGEATPNEISIYPVSFDSIKEIKTVLDAYNVGREKNDMVTYTDMSELLGTVLSSLVNTVSYALIAFTGVSLVVSSIMIGIITYVSVLERTKEIGILRSIGARKKDVTRVFNAETFLIGLFSGIIGIFMTYLLSIPINLIIKALAEVDNIASLNIGYAVILIGVSVFLTLVSGLIPSVKAAKKDPVTALRTE